MRVVPDYQAPNGLWVRSNQVGKVRHLTRSGAAHTAMTMRCLPGGSRQIKDPCYIGCSNTFESFQEFASWYVQQFGAKDDWQLDKDLLVPGNKVYSPDTCVLLPSNVNTALQHGKLKSGGLPGGVTPYKDKYRARHSLFGKENHLGYFFDVRHAFAAYASAKSSYIRQLAEIYRSRLDPRAYAALLRYQVPEPDYSII